MSKIKPLDENVIIDFLTAGTTEAQHHDDPLTQSNLTVTLDDLQPYDLNPRRSKNPKYNEIRDSIENVGLKNSFKITRRHPDDNKYSIRDGGNTRLEALQELYLKYKEKAEQADIEDADKQTYLQKADSFYRINCVFVPFSDDIDALSNHMIENEARCGTKFIERALVVAQYRKLFREQDEKNALEKGEEFEYKPLSSRALAERISALGWMISYSHISRYNYATNTLIKYIPDALWAGVGHSVANKISALYKAYKTFWLATAHGKAHPEDIDDLFYTTLSEFDDEKVDIDGFTKTLDMELDPIVNMASASITAEINALLRNSKRSLKYEPNALIKNNTPVTQPDNSGDIPQPSHNTSNTNAGASTQSQPSQPSRQAAKIQPSYTENHADRPTTPASAPAPSSYSGLPDEIIELNNLITAQAQLIENMTPGFIGVTIFDNTDVSALIKRRGALYDVNKFYEDKYHTFPIANNPPDDERTMLWWQLQKYCGNYMGKQHGLFTSSMSRALASYIDILQSVNQGNNLIDVIMNLEYKLLAYPDMLHACTRLQQLQSDLVDFYDKMEVAQ